ncbi:unnamed protein product [Sphagnum jensenii]
MLLNEAFVKIFNEIWLLNQKDFKLCTQIHDSVLFQYREGREDLAWKVVEKMKNETTITDTFGIKRTMTVPVDLKADKTRKEKFLMDLSGFVDPKETGYKIKVKDPQYDSVTSTNLWGSDSEDKDIKQVYICSDELAEFTGFSNLDFYTTLGNLWDWDEEDTPFEERFKNSASISIYQPTINLLGGTTAELFSKIFPPEALGSEHLMPKALGEFGKSKNSEVTSKIMNKLEEATIPLSPAELWSYVRRDLEHQRNLMDILQGLLAAGKIQVISKPKIGYLPKKEIRKKDEYVNWQFLTQEERDMIGV